MRPFPASLLRYTTEAGYDFSGLLGAFRRTGLSSLGVTAANKRWFSTPTTNPSAASALLTNPAKFPEDVRTQRKQRALAQLSVMKSIHGMADLRAVLPSESRNVHIAINKSITNCVDGEKDENLVSMSKFLC